MNNERIFIALGANLGNVLESFRQAIELLRQADILIVQCSSAYRTPALVAEPVDEEPPAYWNAVIEVRTDLSPMDLLHVMQSVENNLGRVRKKRWESRTIDLDLIAYGGLTLKQEKLSIPHPEMHRRAFVLVPLEEVAADFVVPEQNKTVKQLVQELPRNAGDIMEVEKDWL